jgi:hypothetical protein
MGLITSKSTTEGTFEIHEDIIGAYAGAMQHEEAMQKDGAYAGGGCGCSRVGGASGVSDLAEASEYVDSINSKSKTRIIESIIEAAGKLGLKTEGSTPAAKIKSLLAAIPAGDRFKRDDKAQAQVCESVAKAINAAYGVKVMETNLPADALCQHIAEILSSLGAGVHTEFLAVYSDVQKVLHNLQVLESQLTVDMNQIKDKIRGCEDGVTAKNLQLNFDLYEMLTGEIKRQMQLLSNLLNVHLVPSAADLSRLLKDKKELHGWIKKIDLKPGSDKFGRVISDLLRGLGITANFMLIVEQALATVGLTLREYKEMKNLSELKAAVVSKGLSLSGDELHKFNDSLELLEKNLSKVKYTPIVGSYSEGEMYGQGSLVSGADETASEPKQTTGAYAGGDTYARSTMDKRVADRKKLRNLIYETFVRQLNGVLDKFIGALDVLSMKIGTEIPISDQLDGFRQAINRIDLELARKKQVYLALIGYYNDAMSKSKRDQVVGEMKMVSSFIDSIVELPMYRASAGHFQAVQAQIKALLDIIGKYSDEIAAKFGRGEAPEEEKSEREGGYASAIGSIPVGGYASMVGSVPVTGRADKDTTTGGNYGVASAVGKVMSGSGASAIDEIDGGASGILAADPNSLYYQGSEELYGGDDNRGDRGDFPAPKFRATKTLNDAVRQFDYKFRVAQIRGNLTRAGSELSHYGEKYEKITTNSLAELLQEEHKKYRGLVAALDQEAATAKPPDGEAAAARKFLDGQWEAKRKFWATVEALDGYMRAFYNGLVNNPNDVSEIRAILDEVEVIRDWYSEASGNQLATVFDHFPSKVNKGVDAVADPANHAPKEHLEQDDGNSHYYESLSKNNVTPGDHTNVAVASKGVLARDMLKRMLSSMTALKNLLSVFVHFGSKFGGNDLNKSTFLTPAQIYNNLIDYLQASAFQQGYNIPDNKIFSTDGKVSGTEWDAFAEAKVADTPINTTLSETGRFVRHWGVTMRGIDRPKNGLNFTREDDYFVIIMKAIGAKILTVTSMYDVMDRPHEFNGISPIRMIMGGDSETPKVEEGAVALYLRLPLLCQFWRVIFNFDERRDNNVGEGENRFEPYPGLPMKDNDLVKISMVPDVDGTFAGLIRLIFRKQKYLDTSAYSDDDIKDIIRECNMIYQKMVSKHPQNTVMETIYELIAEVNRRYGAVTEADRKSYDAEFGHRYDYGQGSSMVNGEYVDRYSRDPDPADIALLPGEDEEAIPRPSGAERILEGTDFTKSTVTKSKYNINSDHQKLLYKFRCVIDKFFENPREEYSFNGAIKSTQQKLKRETRDEERFKIVASLVRGVDVYSKVDGLKYLFFHETVVAGLNVLSGLHSMLARFQARAHLLDLGRLVTSATEVLKDSTKDATSTLVAQKLAELFKSKSTTTFLSDADLTEFTDELLGKNEAKLCASGRNGGDWTIRPTADAKKTEVLRFNGQKATSPVDDTILAGTDGLAKVLAGIKASNLRGLFFERQTGETEKDQQQRVHCFFRYLINREFAMKEIIESLFGLSSDLQGLVEVRIDDGKLYMNAGGLKSMISELFEQIGYFIELMRPHIRNDVLQKYTSKIHAGSFYWLQEQLLEKIIHGRPGTADVKSYNNLDDQMRSVSDMYSFLTREFKFNGDGINDGKVSPVASRNSFDKVFASLVFYDGERPGSGLLPAKEKAKGWDNTNKLADSSPQFVDYATNAYEALHLAGPIGAQVLDLRFASRFYQLYNWSEELTLNRSALFVFNQLVAKFIQSFYEPVARKMYKGLLDQFANGTFNRAINDHRYTYPDVAPAILSKFSGPEDLKTPPSLLGPVDLTTRARKDDLDAFLKQYLKYDSTNKVSKSQAFNMSPANKESLRNALGKEVAAHLLSSYAKQATVIVAFDNLALAVNKTVAVNKPDFDSVEKARSKIAALSAAEWSAIFGDTDFRGKAGTTFRAAYDTMLPAAAGAVAMPNENHHLLLALFHRGGVFGVENSLFDAVTEAYPYSSNCLGSSSRDEIARIEMLSDLTLRMAHEANDIANNSVDKLSAAYDKVRASMASRNVHSAGRAATAAFLVKSEDLPKLNTERAWEGSILDPSYEDFVVQYARKDAIGNGAGAGTISNLGIQPPGGDYAGALDGVDDLKKFGNRADPDGDHVLFSSLAVVVRNLVHTRNLNQTQSPVYMVENIADLPLFMKEKMRANLPAFRNLFRELISRCEFLKKFMMRREMNLERHFVSKGTNNAPGEPLHNPWPWVLLKPSTASESDRAKDRFASVLDTIMRGSQTLITACETTLKEVGDDPKYLETHQGSIRDYRAQYGVDPLMPVSSLLATMTNVKESNELDFFPIHSLGELHFKMLYGSRSLLQNMAATPTAESVPGWTQTVESFNLMVDSRLQADRGHTDGLLKSLTKGIRYLYNLKRIKGLLTPHISLKCAGEEWVDDTKRNALYSSGSFVRGDLVADGTVRLGNTSSVSITSADVEKMPHLKPVFALRQPLTRVVMLTESSNRDDQLKNLVEYICGEDKGDRPNTLAVQNIIDLNIIPINVHALMREIPLATLYNYAYTYDRAMIELYYGQGGDGAKDMIRDLCADSGNINAKINSPKDMLVAMLLDPYMDSADNKYNNVDSRQRREYIVGMLLGATGEEGLGRPKFLSDQIYGKVIFGELYTSWQEMSDMGPAVRYPRTMLRSKVLPDMAKALKDVIADACGSTKLFVGPATPIDAVASDLANMFLGNQTASIETLARNISRIGTDVDSAAGGADGHKAFHTALAIIVKVVGSAFLWAVDKELSGDANASKTADTIIKAMKEITVDGNKLKLDGMLGVGINNNAVKMFSNLANSLKDTDASKSPIAVPGTAITVDIAKYIKLVDASVTLVRDNPRNVHSRDAPQGKNVLHYMQNGTLKNIGFTDTATLIQTGSARFDTVIVRNLVFVVNLYRSIRLRLQRDLTYSKDIITRSIPITRNQLTEFAGNVGLGDKSIN